MSRSITIRADMGDLNRMIDALGTEIEEAIRPAAKAGADVLYNEVKKNVASMGRVSGKLAASIYRVYSKDNSGPGRATYHISWNAKKAPHGHLLEYGHLQRYRVYVGKNGHWYTDKKRPLKQPRLVGARPFVRPAQAKFPDALMAAETELFRYLNEGPLKNDG